jgi:hypothetical protein
LITDGIRGLHKKNKKPIDDAQNTFKRKKHPSTASCLSVVVLGKHGPMRMYMSQFHTTPWTLKRTLNTKRGRRLHGFVCTVKQGK